ncbi:hypothetical protein [Flavobacterium sp. JAS]|uniref:hypothetical protein n=1 Tax=Flavobacterium sp. JAS TaxID=2897329 RepID=UPI001E52707D|nr:hypothetical protein [Flavobacterium sp. JAS]MCD0472304.1 hypothetical protein [Flavobacterium sp. JAS]
MKKTKLDYINIFLVVILGLLVILNFAVRFINKEQDKMLWNAEIHSSAEQNSSSENLNSVKIVEAVFYNNFNHSTSGIDSESDWVTNAKSENSVHFKIWEKELLPDSLSLKYFSIDERKFYLLTTPLPYKKMKDLVKGKENTPVLILEIRPKGKVLLKMIQSEEEKTEPQFVEEFISKETTGNLDMLVYEVSLGEKYNRYEGIENITDYSDLLQNQFKWSVQIEKQEQAVLTSIYAYSFIENRIEISEDNDVAVARSIPKIFYIYWKNKKEYNIQYELSPVEVLNAFRKLNQTNTSDPITLRFKVYKKAYIQCEISKNGIVIPLKDLYPE